MYGKYSELDWLWVIGHNANKTYSQCRTDPLHKVVSVYAVDPITTKI